MTLGMRCAHICDSSDLLGTFSFGLMFLLSDASVPGLSSVPMSFLLCNEQPKLEYTPHLYPKEEGSHTFSAKHLKDVGLCFSCRKDEKFVIFQFSTICHWQSCEHQSFLFGVVVLPLYLFTSRKILNRKSKIYSDG